MHQRGYAMMRCASHLRAGLLSTLGFGVAATAMAADGPLPENGELCFQRAYTAAYFEQHPEQTVSEIQLALEHDTQYDMIYATFRIMLRDDTLHRFGNTASCRWRDEMYSCGIDCDSGSFYIEFRDDGAVRLTNHGVTLYGGCGYEGDGEFEDSIYLRAEPDDRLFLLYPVTVEACQYLAFDE